MHTDERHPIDTIIEEFVSRFRAGETPSVETYAQKHPDLADDIRSLLPAATLLEELKETSPSLAPDLPDLPEVLGDFRILREIGRGGMGIVYEAEQLSLDRRVALKVLPAQARLSDEQRERFRREAHAAGRLHHPNIVPVFGVGEHEGISYYVMQLIPGKGLDRLMERLQAPQSPAAGPVPEDNHISLPAFSDPRYSRAIARLGLQVAEALAYAHEQGVLHRDIKPANLLLDEAGNVWVTDFGLAKLSEQNDLTQTGEMAGTLRYSAPERFQGKSDARSDIYALGLTLYELLTLSPAYDEEDPGSLLWQAAQPQVKPPRQRNQTIPRDLETVVLRSLAPEPDRRYASARLLADDLRRFLEDRPVRARRASVLEHWLRWGRRNPAVAGLSLALLLVCVLSFAVVLWKWGEASASFRAAQKVSEQLQASLEREEGERRQTEQQRRRAQSHLDLALQAFERIAGRLALGRPGAALDAPDEGPAPPLISPESAAILQDMVRFYERFTSCNTSDPRLRRDTARALRRIGTIRQRLGEYGPAEEALRRSAELFAGLPELRLELAQVHNDIGIVLRGAGRPADAAREHEKALEVLKKDTRQDGNRRHELAKAHNLLGAAQLRTLRVRQAEQSQRTALKLVEELAKGDPRSPEYRQTQARVYHDLSRVFWPGEKRTEAGKARRAALEILEGLARDFPAVPDYRAELTELLLSPAPRLLSPRFGWDAQKRSTRANELAEELVAKHPAVPEYQSLLARARQRQGLLQQLHGNNFAALKSYRQSVKLHRSLVERFPYTPAYRLPGLEARWALADLLRQRKQWVEAEKLLRESLEEMGKFGRATSRNPYVRRLLSRHYRSLGLTLQGQGKKEEAEKTLRLAGDLGITRP